MTRPSPASAGAANAGAMASLLKLVTSANVRFGTRAHSVLMPLALATAIQRAMSAAT